MKTKLIEFPNTKNEILRGIITIPEGDIQRGVICVHGFERNSTTEKKFKVLADALAEKMIATLRFDFSGLGLSDGDFRETTITKQSQELQNAILAFQKELNLKNINIIAHSLGGVIVADYIQNTQSKINKILLIAPALNQRDLLRYRFVVSQMKTRNPQKEITRDNYKAYLNENEFQKDCGRTDKTTKINNINADYFMEAKDIDFSHRFDSIQEHILHIHGEKDIAVPIDSIESIFKNQIIVKNGDHDLEKPQQREERISKAIYFINKQE